MPSDRRVVEVTENWQLIATASALFQITKKGKRQLMFNETMSDETANVYSPSAGDQFYQSEAKNTYVRSNSTGWCLLADGPL